MACQKCPRHCDNTLIEKCFCHADSRLPEVAAVYAHRGEEPPISGEKGISNIFFAHCNLQCLYCQNHIISRAQVNPELVKYRGIDEIADATVASLQETENILGLVSATQYSDIIPILVEALHKRDAYPTIVYNTNGYESVETLQALAPYIDVYLPDFKYSDSRLAMRYSNAANYPEIAGAALKEMYSQKGSALATDDNDIAFRGIIVRHLVLPGQVQNSIDSLRWIAENISTSIHISLMAQYYPPEGLALPDQLNRKLGEDEYEAVTNELQNLGFRRGWVQQLESSDSYRPHFSTETSFA